MVENEEIPREAPRCQQCGAARVGEVCQSCGATDERVLDETRRAIEQSRERLSAWRERLSKRLEESERKRDILSDPDALAASQAPTRRLADTTDGRDQALGTSSNELSPKPPNLAGDLVEPTPPPRRRDPLEAARNEVGAAPLRPPTVQYVAPPPDDRFTDPDHVVSSESPQSPMVLDGNLFGDDAPSAWNSGGGTSPKLYTVSDRDVDQAPVPLQREPERTEAPSLVRRAAGMMLDIVILLLGPAALLTIPLGWITLENSVGILWEEHTVLLAGFFLVIFILLVTTYVGAVGRTPGMRLVGTRITDETGQIPTFSRALVRALLLPFMLVPAAERAVEVRTVIE